MTPADPATSASAPAHAGDEFWGQGGSFIVDPKTGKRTRAPEVVELTGDGSGEALPLIDATVERTAPATKKGK